MYTDFIAYAYNAGYEFVTSEDLAARIAAQQKATLTETTNGNVITATVTPDPTAPDLGAMALNVINGAAGQVIQNAGNWYAYDSQQHLPALRRRHLQCHARHHAGRRHAHRCAADARRSQVGDRRRLEPDILDDGDGMVDVHVKTPGANIISIQGAPAATLNGDDLSLTFNDGALAVSSTSPQGVPVLHNVTISDGATAVASSGNDIIFGGIGQRRHHRRRRQRHSSMAAAARTPPSIPVWSTTTCSR